ncbi:MAG TPA: BON domain-containing protein [Ktedonobacterales bacterium]
MNAGWAGPDAAGADPAGGHLFSERSLSGSQPTRRVLRLGERVRAGDLPTVPARYRGGLGGPNGVLVGMRLRARTGEVWCRLRAARPWRRAVRTVPLNTVQPPTPTPDTLDLRRHMRVDCQGGEVGRLEGVAVDLQTGLATGLLIRVRGDVDADVTRPTDPLAPLLPVAGQRFLVSPSAATKVDKVARPLPLAPGRARLMLAATAAQVAHSLALGDDAALKASVWEILSANPSLAPFLAQVRVEVHDGTVVLLGSLPSVRQKLAAEQDVWHVPGVLAVQNEVAATAS